MIKKILLLSLFGLPFTQFCCAMESSTYQEVNMQEISSFQDAQKFLGMMVAYKTQSSELKHKDEYTLYSGQSVAYGYIERATQSCRADQIDSLEWGCTMLRLIKNAASQKYCWLTDSNLKGAALLLRIITPEEKETIHQAVNSGTAVLEYVSIPAEACAIIEGGPQALEEYRKKLLAHWKQ